MPQSSPPSSDLWSEWLLGHRHGGDPTCEGIVRSEVGRYVDHLLDLARLGPGMVLVDVGTGDGAVAFRAIDRAGPSLRVHLTDISAPLLRHVEALAIERGFRSQCSFHEGAADDLCGLPDTSADIVTTRAVLAYVADKPAALQEFHRVLKPGGRVAIAEPVLQDEALMGLALKSRIEALGAEEVDPVARLLCRWKSAQYPDTLEKIAVSPITNYTERDLLRLVSESGFVDAHLEFHVSSRPAAVTSWSVFLASSPHPWAPTSGSILEALFDQDEQRLLENFMRPLIEGGMTSAVDRIAYVTAVKPSANRLHPLSPDSVVRT